RPLHPSGFDRMGRKQTIGKNVEHVREGTEMKKPHPPGRKRGQSNTSKRRNSNKVLSPRLARLLTALLKKPRTVRQLIDEIPTNNPAEYASILRRRFGLTIPCEHKRFITIDGRR